MRSFSYNPANRRRKIHPALFTALLTCCFFARADIAVYISGTITAPPCVINADQMINVDFGDSLVTTRIDEDAATGQQNVKTIVYTLQCDRNIKARMKILGPPAPFDPRLLAAGQDNLGIAIRINNKVIEVNNTEYEFTYPNSPKLVALPVKAANTVLEGGRFDVGATMVLSFP